MTIYTDIDAINDLDSNIRSRLDAVDFREPEQKDKAVEFHVSSILNREIGFRDGLLKKKQKQLDDAVIQLKEQLEKDNGSEVATSMTESRLNWVRQQEIQLEHLEGMYADQLTRMKAAYLEYFGKAWMPYSVTQELMDKQKQTAARSEAEEMLAKYNKA